MVALRLILLCYLPVFASENGWLTIQTEPEGADVFFTGVESDVPQFIGKTPMHALEFPSGMYGFYLIKDDYDTIRISDVYLAPGRQLSISQTLVYSYASLVVKSFPDSAEVFLDEVRVGQTAYFNRLVLPGKYLLTISPKDSLYKIHRKNISVKKSDSLVFFRRLLYRSKSFENEHLALTPWRIQVETGFQRTSYPGQYDNSAEDLSIEQSGEKSVEFEKRELKFSSRNFPADSVPSSLLMPMVLRLGLPNNIEFHLHLPFRKFNPSRNNQGSFGPSDMRIGAKYTLRKYKAGLDATYKFDNGSKLKQRGSGYQSLALTAMAMLSKKAFQLYGNAGYEFRFTAKTDPNLNYGDDIFVYAQAGYLMNPWLPYLAVHGDLFFDNMREGNKSDGSGGYLVAPEAGIIVDATEGFALQLGIPFSVAGKNALKYWGVHFSLAWSVGLK